uniref:Uncharacterized protein n=1 Tax=Lepeophtheirus salmonis TaxID=72036 RepID=A0A0K2UJR2_LEPSM
MPFSFGSLGDGKSCTCQTCSFSNQEIEADFCKESIVIIRFGSFINTFN